MFKILEDQGAVTDLHGSERLKAVYMNENNGRIRESFEENRATYSQRR